MLGLQRDLENSDVYNRECSISEAYLIIDNFSKRLVVLENEAQVNVCLCGRVLCGSGKVEMVFHHVVNCNVS